MKRWHWLLGTFLLVGHLAANNILVDQIVLKDVNPTTQTMHVEFDVRWDNAWRIEGGAFNHDAAWVFMKFKVRGGSWQHARVTAVHFTPPGATIDPSTDRAGAMIYRTDAGGSSVLYDNVSLVWDYAADGVTDEQTDQLAVRVFAIEMVYVPQNRFQLGGTGTETSKFYRVSATPSARDPYQVTSEDAIPVGSAVGNLYYDAGTLVGDRTGTLPAAFPKGFRSFYAMKYEVSQQQYVDFFNTLNPDQRAALDLTGGSNKGSTAETSRNAISGPDAESLITTLHPDLPVNYVRALQGLAYLDWAGLRPMTELEFEKLCRGPVSPVAGEYAWGSSAVYTTEYTVSGEGSPNEAVANADRLGAANAVYGATAATLTTTVGPLRTGIFANQTAAFDRPETGGSFYGLMELSGNLGELVVTAGSPAGRAFTGAHGDGNLTAAGSHDVDGWPTAADGLGSRGGSFGDPAARLAVGDRTTAASYDAAIQFNGLRGVRTAN